MTYFTVNIYLEKSQPDEVYLPTHCHPLRIIQFLN